MCSGESETHIYSNYKNQNNCHQQKHTIRPMDKLTKNSRKSCYTYRGVSWLHYLMEEKNELLPQIFCLRTHIFNAEMSVRCQPVQHFALRVGLVNGDVFFHVEETVDVHHELRKKFLQQEIRQISPPQSCVNHVCCLTKSSPKLEEKRI